MYQIPVVVIVFNRPEETKLLINALRKIKPANIFIIGDGPRKNGTDLLKIRGVKSVLAEIDWECQIRENFSEINLGCQKRVSSGLSWVFSYVEKAIILEDDCIPNISFFEYCKDNLELYKNDTRVMSISGTRLAPVKGNNNVFSNYSICWGWATWSRAWKYYENDLGDLDELIDRNFFRFFFGSRRASYYWCHIFSKLNAGKLNSWAYRWMLSCWKMNGLSLVPPCNLIENIGEGIDATHTKDKNKFLGVISTEMKIEDNYSKIFHDLEMDRWIEDNFYSKSILSRMSWLIKKLINRFN